GPAVLDAADLDVERLLHAVDRDRHVELIRLDVVGVDVGLVLRAHHQLGAGFRAGVPGVAGVHDERPVGRLPWGGVDDAPGAALRHKPELGDAGLGGDLVTPGA